MNRLTELAGALVDGALPPLWVSLRSAGLAVACVVPLGLLAAQLVRRWQGRRRTLADLLLLSPLVLPPTVVGFLLLELLGRSSPVGALLERWGIEIVFRWQATVLAAAVVAFPLMYRSALAALESIDPALPQVARSLGAGEARVLLRITLPLALPGLLAGLSLSFARALGEFGTTMMLAGNIPGRTQTLPLAIYAAVDGGQTGQAWLWTAQVLGLNAIGLLLLQGLTGARPRPFRPRPPRRPPAPGEVQTPLQARMQEQEPARARERHRRRGDAPFRLEMNVRRRLAPFRLDLDCTSSCRRLGILGASGAGKTQLLRLLAGLERPDAGRIVLNERILFDQRLGIDLPLRRRRLGLVFQHYALFPHLSVAENVGFGLQDLPRPARDRRVAEELSRVGLLALADCLPAELSGGQQQRVALARALAIDPDVLLLDEPFSAQDTFLRRQLQQQLEDLLDDCRVPALLVSHDFDEAYRLSEELLVLDHGRIVAHGSRDRVAGQPGELVVARLSGCQNLSPVQRRSPTRFWALDWQLELSLDSTPTTDPSHVGVRADQLRLSPDHAQRPLASDQWRVELLHCREEPFQVCLAVTVHQAGGGCGGLLQVQLPREDWRRLRHHPQPWLLTLPREGLLLLRHQGAAAPE